MRSPRKMRWDAGAQKTVPSDRPPTRAQIDSLRELCARRGTEFVPPQTRRDAQSMLGKLAKHGRATVKPCA